MKKKLSALFMVFAMVLSLFSGLGVNTVWADANEKEGGDTEEVISGLAAMDWLEWDDNGNIKGPNEQATWMKGLGSVVNGTTLLVKVISSPSSIIFPLSGVWIPISVLASVDFPPPFGPVITSISPSST